MLDGPWSLVLGLLLLVLGSTHRTWQGLRLELGKAGKHSLFDVKYPQGKERLWTLQGTS